jgi:hypothetical protein
MRVPGAVAAAAAGRARAAVLSSLVEQSDHVTNLGAKSAERHGEIESGLIASPPAGSTFVGAS